MQLIPLALAITQMSRLSRLFRKKKSPSPQSKTTYITDPRLIDQNKKLQEQKKKLQEQKKKLQEQKKELNKKVELHQKPELVVERHNFQRVINKNPGQCHIGFIGFTSVGKSSLLNHIFDLKGQRRLKTGLKKTTLTATQAFRSGNNVYWDFPGFDSQFSYLRAGLNYLKDLDQIYVLYNGQIDDIATLLKVIWKIGKIPKLVRTKCDQAESKEEISDAIQQDYQDLRQLTSSRHLIFPSSNRNEQLNTRLVNSLL